MCAQESKGEQNPKFRVRDSSAGLWLKTWVSEVSRLNQWVKVSLGYQSLKAAGDSSHRSAVKIRWYKGQGSGLGAGIQDKNSQDRSVLFAQSCPILCDPMDCRPPGSSVHGILQARILDWVAIPFSRGSS